MGLTWFVLPEMENNCSREPYPCEHDHCECRLQPGLPPACVANALTLSQTLSSERA
jgi:hypothetical protein